MTSRYGPSSASLSPGVFAVRGFRRAYCRRLWSTRSGMARGLWRATPSSRRKTRCPMCLPTPECPRLIFRPVSSRLRVGRRHDRSCAISRSAHRRISAGRRDGRRVSCSASPPTPILGETNGWVWARPCGSEFQSWTLSRLDAERAVLVDHLTVDGNLGLSVEIADEVPVDRADVLAPRLRITTAQGEMEAAADFLVQQDIAREALDAEVRTNGELT